MGTALFILHSQEVMELYRFERDEYIYAQGWGDLNQGHYGQNTCIRFSCILPS